jgi:protein-L-isoaspartate(D-aspartate) O-methyltransferase
MNTTILYSKPRHRRSFLAGLISFFLPTFPLVDAYRVDLRAKANDDEWARARRAMIERQLLARGIRDARVLQAMGSIPRELFVPEKVRDQAYHDRPLPIGARQTISQPYIVAYMTELLGLKGMERILEIGTGSGYQAAVLGKLAAEVYSIEILPALSGRAKTVIEQLGFDNIFLKVGDGFFGWPEKSPFDAILITAAAPRIPEPLWVQLREGGRLIMPLGEEGRAQKLIRVTKSGGKRMTEEVSGVYFVPLTGAIQSDHR